MTDGTGALVGTSDYAAFGAVRATTGTTSRFGYTGEQVDPATGSVYLRARYVDPELGRFLSMDTVQPNAPGTQGFNRCAYVANNPATFTDPSGHESDAAVCGNVVQKALTAAWAGAEGWLVAKGPRAHYLIKIVAVVGRALTTAQLLQLLPDSKLTQAFETALAPMLFTFGGAQILLFFFGDASISLPIAFSLLLAGVLFLLAATYIKAILLINEWAMGVWERLCSIGLSDQDELPEERSGSSPIGSDPHNVNHSVSNMPSLPALIRPSAPR